MPFKCAKFAESGHLGTNHRRNNMDSIRCADCNLSFCSRYNLSRHRLNKHSEGNSQCKLTGTSQIVPQGAPYGAHLGAPPPHGAHLEAPPPHGAHLGAPPPHGAPYGEKSMILYHPFTMMISGPTGN